MEIDDKYLCDLIHWARRYCDKRMTGAAHQFNVIYNKIRSQNPDIIRCGDTHDTTLTQEGKFWPYAQDGMYDEESGYFDAR